MRARCTAILVVRRLIAYNLTPTTHSAWMYTCFVGSLWQSVSVVGDAGVNHLGYYTCAWRPDGRAIATHGHSGAIHVWDAGRAGGRRDDRMGGGGEEEDDIVYFHPRTPACCCGHMGPVVDASWSPDGSRLCTVSADQTCRIWASSPENPANGDGLDDDACWREVGRPQVHGHDFSCVTFVSNDVYVSGSDEKVLRVFCSSLTDEHGAPVRVKLPALGLSNVVCMDGAEASGDHEGMEDSKHDTNNDLDNNNNHASITEEDLSQNTLWPEIRKLYGHGNDLFRVAADPKGRYIVSASRAQEPMSASIIFWDTATWTEVAREMGHDLTVTCIDCSDSGNLVATVGRDRRLIVWERLGAKGSSGEGHGNIDDENCGKNQETEANDKTNDETNDETNCDHDMSNWRIKASKSKAHARVIWGCSWVDESTLVTSARDGTVSVWSVGSGVTNSTSPATACDDGNDAQKVGEITEQDMSGRTKLMPKAKGELVKLAETKLGSSVTTVAARGPIIAAGLESGEVVMLSWTRRLPDGRDIRGGCPDGQNDHPGKGGTVDLPGRLDVVSTCAEELKHSGAVRRVCFRPSTDSGSGALLSSVGDDNAVKFWKVLV